MTVGHPYPLGMAPAEIARLERQHRTWRRATAQTWRWAGFAKGQTVADLGCGPGFTSLDLARLVGPTGRVVAVDASPVAAEQARAAAAARGLGNMEVVADNIEHLDLSRWRSDGVFARWLFCYLPRPDAAVRRIAGSLTPGARVAVMDYWNYLAIRTEPDSPLFRRVFEAVYQSFADAGGSMDVGGRLPALFEVSGIRVKHVEAACQVGGPGTPVWRWLSEFQDLYLPTLAEKGYLTTPELAEYEGWWSAISVRAGSLLFAPPVLCVAGVRA